MAGNDQVAMGSMVVAIAHCPYRLLLDQNLLACCSRPQARWTRRASRWFRGRWDGVAGDIGSRN